MRFLLTHEQSAILLPVLSILSAYLQNCSRKAYPGGRTGSRRREELTALAMRCISSYGRTRKELVLRPC